MALIGRKPDGRAESERTAATQSKRRPPPAKRVVGSALAATAAFMAKAKTIVVAAVKLKLLTTAGTMAVSMAAYSFVFGWAFAAGLVGLPFVHEIGHVIQLHREGIAARLPMFVPFMVAVIAARSLGEDALAEARVGLAGPILGSVGAATCVLAWRISGGDLWRALAFTAFFVNLFNLLPVVPLDGGRATAAIAPRMWFLGLAALVPLMVIFRNPIVLVIGVFAAFETYERWKLRKTERQRNYYRVRPLDRTLVAGPYLSLTALLVVGMHVTALTRTFT